jgi:hypothetical protein
MNGIAEITVSLINTCINLKFRYGIVKTPIKKTNAVFIK